MGKFSSIFGGSPKAPPPPPPPEAPPPAAAPATAADPTVVNAGNSQRQRSAAGVASTVGNQGFSGLKTPPKTSNVTLLGGS